MSIIVNSMWGFVFALMKCSYAAFGEQNKMDNDSKCQQVYKSHKIKASIVSEYPCLYTIHFKLYSAPMAPNI